MYDMISDPNPKTPSPKKETQKYHINSSTSSKKPKVKQVKREKAKRATLYAIRWYQTPLPKENKKCQAVDNARNERTDRLVR